MVGLVASASVVVQAVLLATVIARALQDHAGVGSLAPWLAGLAGAFGVRALSGWVGEAAAQRTSVLVTATLRRQLLRHVLDLGPSWLAGERAGELSLTATRGTAALDVYFGRYLPQAVLAVLAPMGILAWVGWEDWVSLLVLLGVAALVPMAMVVFGRRSAQQTQRQWKRLTSLSARFLELVQGLPTLRAFGRSAQGRREVEEATEGLRLATMQTLRVAFLSALALEFLSGIGVGLVAMVLGLRLLDGSVPLATALAVLLVSPELFLPMRRAGAEFHASNEGKAAAARILDVLDTPAVAQEGTRMIEVAHPDVAVEGVRVAFGGRAGPVLEGFDLHVGAGEHVALVGPSGSGKSTVLALLLGFVQPSAGSVRLGGVALGDARMDSWRQVFAWVPQRPHLFDGSIAENVALGKADAAIEDVWGAVELAGLAEFVKELPHGLDTRLGAGGLTVSSGERTRLAIARAVLRDAPVVLLDEPAAHLDATTEGWLGDALAPWFEGRTVVVAAHRPQLVGRIDRTVAIGGPA